MVRWERSGPWVAVGGLVVMVWLVISTVLYAPWWGVLLHGVALAVVASRLPTWSRRSPATSPGLVVVALLVWAAINALGVGLLGWRAD